MNSISLLARCGLICILFSSFTFAGEGDKPQSPTSQNARQQGAEQQIRARFKASRPDLVLGKIEKSRIPGIFAVQINGGPLIHATEDGKYFFSGDLYSLADHGVVNLSEQGRQVERVASLKKVKRKDMIIFSPPGKPKASLYVFTDVDCPYCRKLHKEVPELNKLGIEVRYLAFPVHHNKPRMVTVWCSDDRNSALTAMKNGESVPEKTCPNPVDDEMKLGARLGVQGTPGIVTTDGTLLPGYMPAEKLAQVALKHSAK